MTPQSAVVKSDVMIATRRSQFCGCNMNLLGTRELEVTREKLRLLEEHYRRRPEEPAENPHTRELSLLSLKKTINQLKEEIARYEAHASAK